MEWKQIFYASDGYFENYPPENDGISQLLMQNIEMSNRLIIKELSLVPNNDAKKLIVKIEKKNTLPLYGKSLKVMAQITYKGQKQNIEIEATCTLAYAPEMFYVFVSEPLNPVISIQEISNIILF
jgi:hypothetical protein